MPLVVSMTAKFSAAGLVAPGVAAASSYPVSGGSSYQGIVESSLPTGGTLPMERSCPGGLVSGAGLMPVYQFAPTGFLGFHPVLQPIVYPCLAPMGLAPVGYFAYPGMAAAQSFSCGAQPRPFGLVPHMRVRQHTGSLASRAHLSVPPEPPWWSANRMDLPATSNQASGDMATVPASPATTNQASEEATVPGNFQAVLPDSYVNGRVRPGDHGRVRPGDHGSGGALFFQGGNHGVHFDSHGNSRMLSDSTGMMSDNHGSGGAFFQGANYRVHFDSHGNSRMLSDNAGMLSDNHGSGEVPFDSHGNQSGNHANAMMRNNRVSDNHGNALSNDNHGNSELHSDGHGQGYSRHHGNGVVSPSSVCGAYCNHGNGEVSLDHLNNVEARSTRPAGRAESRVLGTPDLKGYNNLLSQELKYSQNPRKTYPHSVNNAVTSEKKSASKFPLQPGVVVSQSSNVPPRRPTTTIAENKEEILGVLRKNGAMGIEELSMRLGMEQRWVQMCLQELQESGEVVRKGGEYSTCAK